MDALTGNGSSREPRSGQLSPGFHFSKGEGKRGEGFVLVTPFTDLKTSKLFHSNHFVFFSWMFNKFKLKPASCRVSFSRLTHT